MPENLTFCQKRITGDNHTLGSISTATSQFGTDINRTIVRRSLHHKDVVRERTCARKKRIELRQGLPISKIFQVKYCASERKKQTDRPTEIQGRPPETPCAAERQEECRKERLAESTERVGYDLPKRAHTYL